MFWKYDEEEDKVVEREQESDEYGSSDETGAEERFEKRKEVFRQESKPLYKHHIWWFIHNCIAHPMIGIAPSKFTFDFHDWTSKKINGR